MPLTGELATWAQGMSRLLDPRNGFLRVAGSRAGFIVVMDDRSDRSWDNPHRRPSHADRRRRIIREMLRKQSLTDLPHDLERSDYQARILQLVSLAA